MVLPCSCLPQTKTKINAMLRERCLSLTGEGVRDEEQEILFCRSVQPTHASPKPYTGEVPQVLCFLFPRLFHRDIGRRET